jgi:hypothetical protein
VITKQAWVEKRLVHGFFRSVGRFPFSLAHFGICGVFSSDLGRTWSRRAVLQEGHPGGSAYSSALLRMTNGDPDLFYGCP